MNNFQKVLESLVVEHLPTTEIIKLTEEGNVPELKMVNYNRILQERLGYQNYLKDVEEQKGKSSFQIFKEINNIISNIPVGIKVFLGFIEPNEQSFGEMKRIPENEIKLALALIEADKIEFFFDNDVVYNRNLTVIRITKNNVEKDFTVFTEKIRQTFVPFLEWLKKNKNYLKASSISVSGDYYYKEDDSFVDDETDDLVFVYKKVITPPYKKEERSPYLKSVGLDYWHENRDFNPLDFKGLEKLKISYIPDYDMVYIRDDSRKILEDFISFVRDTGVKELEIYTGSGRDEEELKSFLEKRLEPYGVTVTEEI